MRKEARKFFSALTAFILTFTSVFSCVTLQARADDSRVVTLTATNCEIQYKVSVTAGFQDVSGNDVSGNDPAIVVPSGQSLNVKFKNWNPGEKQYKAYISKNGNRNEIPLGDLIQDNGFSVIVNEEPSGNYNVNIEVVEVTTGILNVVNSDNMSNGSVEYLNASGQWIAISGNVNGLEAKAVRVRPNDPAKDKISGGAGLYIRDVSHQKVDGALDSENGISLEVGKEYELEHAGFEPIGGGGQGGPGGGGNNTSFSWNTMDQTEDRIAAVKYKVNNSGEWITYDRNADIELHENDTITVKFEFITGPNGEQYTLDSLSANYFSKTNQDYRFDYKGSDDVKTIVEKLSGDGYTFTFRPETDCKNADGQSLITASEGFLRLQFTTKQVFTEVAEVFVFMQISDGNGSYGAYVNGNGGDVFADNLYINEVRFKFNGNEYGEQGDPIRLGYGFNNDGQGVNSIGEVINGGTPVEASYASKFQGKSGKVTVNPVSFGYFEVGAVSSGVNQFSISDELIDEVFVSTQNDFSADQPLNKDGNGAYNISLDSSVHRYYVLVRIHEPLTRNIGWNYVEGAMGSDAVVDHGKVFIESVVRGSSTILGGIHKNDDGTIILDDQGSPSYDIDVLSKDDVVGNWRCTPNGGDINLMKDDIVTIKLIPTYGYQIEKAELNGTVLTPNEEVSSFTFKVFSNLHVAGTFVATEDKTNVSGTEVVSEARIYGGENAADSGNLSLTVADNKNYDKSEEAIAEALDGEDAEASVVATLDLSLDNIVSKGNGDYWTSNITSFENDIEIDFELGDIEVEEGQTLAVVRDHEGTLTVLEGVYDAETGRLAFLTNQFSTYSIIKLGTKDPVDPKDPVDSEDPVEPTAPVNPQPAVVVDNSVASMVGGAKIESWNDLSTFLSTPTSAIEEDVPLELVIRGIDSVLPEEVFKALTKSEAGSLHLHLGKGTAINFANNSRLNSQGEVNLKAVITEEESLKTIKFESYDALKAIVGIHSLVPAGTKKVKVYYTDMLGKRTFIGECKPTEEGRFCFAIDKLGLYEIEY